MNLNLYENYDGMFMREREYPSQHMNNKNGNNGETSRFPQNTPIAMAYVPYQQWKDVYDSEAALCSGTLFPELDLPFEKGGASR